MLNFTVYFIKFDLKKKTMLVNTSRAVNYFNTGLLFLLVTRQQVTQ